MKKENIAGVGTIIAALLATSCCIGPAIFIMFGVSVGFLGNLAVLEPYMPWFITAAFLMLGYSFYRLYLRPVECACEEDFRIRKISRIIFWIGTASVVFALTFRKALFLIAS